MPKVCDTPLIGLMLEESLPGCIVDGVDYDTNLNEGVDQQPEAAESFENYEKKLLSAIQSEMTGRYFPTSNIRF